jgi:hypothetical protein
VDRDTHRRLLDDFRIFYEKQLPDPAPHNCDFPEFWAVMKLDDFADLEPETAWSVILDLLREPLNDNALGCLAAGPLEHLIDQHGPSFVDRIEAEAERDPTFRWLLGGVWESSTPEVWARIERARGAAW